MSFRDAIGVQSSIQSVGMDLSSGAQRTTSKNMTHKLKAIKEKTTDCRSSSTVLLPANWSTLRVAKLLHVFANRCAQAAAGIQVGS